jgi:Chlorite dismutase
MVTRLYSFVGGAEGPWRVTLAETITGEPLPPVPRVRVLAGTAAPPAFPDSWVLRGITSNERYVEGAEKARLLAEQPLLGRIEASCAALIPIRKRAEWWALAQDRRREILEERSRHIHIGSTYLPAVARRLHHCRDLGEDEPFDFLTWFEFSSAHEADFNRLVKALRATEEWSYVERELDIRLEREPFGALEAGGQTSTPGRL